MTVEDEWREIQEAIAGRALPELPRSDRWLDWLLRGRRALVLGALFVLVGWLAGRSCG